MRSRLFRQRALSRATPTARRQVFFGVGDTLTRAQFATILWRNACPDEYAAYDPKTAVNTTGIEGSADGMYYTAAANWAVVNGYITGIDNLDGTFDFAADKPVSFEQMVTILSRITATPDEVAASRGDLSAFVDGDMASSWSRTPSHGRMTWALSRVTTTPTGEGSSARARMSSASVRPPSSRAPSPWES